MTFECCRSHPEIEVAWRHVVTEVADGLFVTGEPLPGTYARTAEVWAALGIEVVLDMTTTDHGHLDLPLDRVWLPLEDDGSRRPDWWFEETCEASKGRSTLVHCHLGVARAPSAAFAVLLSRGVDCFTALEAVLATRSVATVAYAVDALEWYCREYQDVGSLPYIAEELENRRRRLVQESRERLEVRF